MGLRRLLAAGPVAMVLIAGCGGSSNGGSAMAPTTASPSVGDSAAQPTPEHLQHFQVLDSAWLSTTQGFGGPESKQFVEYAAVIRNPNRTYYCTYPEFRITAYGAHHRVLGSDTQTLSGLPPLTKVAAAGQIEATQKPMSVKVTYVGQDCQQTVTDYRDYVPLKATQVRLNGHGYDASITGVLHNPYATKFSEVTIVALYYRGSRLVGGDVDFLDNLRPNAKEPFDMSSLSGLKGSIDGVRVDAYPWSDAADWNKAVYKAEGH